MDQEEKNTTPHRICTIYFVRSLQATALTTLICNVTSLKTRTFAWKEYGHHICSCHFLPRIRKPATSLPPLLAVYGHHFQSEVFGKRLECYLWYVATWKYKILSDRSLTADKDQIFCNDYITKKGSEHLKDLKNKFLKAEITLVHVL